MPEKFEVQVTVVMNVECGEVMDGLILIFEIVYTQEMVLMAHSMEELQVFFSLDNNTNMFTAESARPTTADVV